MRQRRPNNRIQATAGGAAVLNSRVERSPAAPDAERYVANPMPTLEELEDDVWGEPEFDSYLVGTCHQLRKKPIEEFTTEDLRIMIGQNIGLQFLIPQAIAVLEDDPLAEGDYYPGDLLKMVISADSSFYDRSPVLVARVLSVARMAIDGLQSPDDADLLGSVQQFVNKYAT